jgi:hypothetical protein
MCYMGGPDGSELILRSASCSVLCDLRSTLCLALCALLRHVHYIVSSFPQLFCNVVGDLFRTKILLGDS